MTLDRNTYIGSSDAKDILDGNWLKLWNEKTGRVPREDLSDKFNVQLGSFTENFHLDWSIRRMIEAGEIHSELAGLRQANFSPDGAPHVAGHVDAIVHLQDGTDCPVEAKHSSGARSVEDLLGWYMPQVQHHLWCADAQKAVVSIIQGNREPERVWIGRSQPYIDVYAAACARFWQYIVTDTAPPGFSPTVIEPTVLDAIRINGKVRRCADGDNAFISVARDLIDNEGAAKVYEGAKKSLKQMMSDDEAEVYSKILTLKKDARGAVRMTVHQDKEVAA